MEWKNDKQLFNIMRNELYTAVVGDIVDTFKRYHQFLPTEIQPISNDMKVAGRAMPVLIADIYQPPQKAFGLLTEALDQLQEDEIYIATGGAMRSAYWGELLTATARMRKAAGAIINGYHRDTTMVLEQNWSVFSRGRSAADSFVRNIVLDYRCPIEIGSTKINPGDLIFADLDGVLVIPKDIEEQVITLALAKARAEKVVRQDIEKGISSTEVFKKHGIL